MKTKLKEADVGEQGCLLLQILARSVNLDRIGPTVLANESKVPRSTVRRIMDRLVMFGLVDEVGRSPQAKTFLLTKEGIAFIKKFQMIEEVPPIQSEPAPSMVKWLREKADELNAMADHLSHYE